MSERKTHWDQVYQNKSPLEVSWYQKQPAICLELIEHTGISKDAALIDVGGGASTLIDHLMAAGYTNLTVLDISAAALAHAQQRMGQQANAVNWIVADVTEFSAPTKYALWHDRAVFHFLTKQSDRDAYISVLRQSLQPGGHMILAAFGIGGPDKCSGLDIVQYDAEKLSAELGKEFVLQEETAETHQTPDGRPQKFGYFRFIYQALST